MSKVAKLKIKKSWLSFLLGFLLYAFSPLSAVGISVSPTAIYFLILGISFFIYLFRASISKKLLAFIFLFLLFYYLSYVISYKTDYSHYKVTMVFVKIPILVLLPCFLKNSYLSFFKGALTAIIFLILLILGDALALIGNMSINNRLEIGYLSPIWLSRILFEGLLISILILKNNWKINLLILLAVLPIAYVSGSKGAIVAATGALFLKYYYGGKSRLKKSATLILTSVLLIGIVFLGQTILMSYGNTFFAQRFLSAVPEKSSEDIKQKSRIVVWPKTVKKYFDQNASEILLGNGVGNFNKFYEGSYQSKRSYPHNLFLELLVEQGLLFLIFFISALVFLMKGRSNEFKYLFYYFLLNAMVSGDLILNEFVFFYLSWTIIVENNFGMNRIENKRVFSC